jgi:hypothetical protein
LEHFLDHIYLYCAVIFYVIPLILYFIHRYIMYFYISIPTLGLTYLWIDHIYAVSQPNYHGGAGGSLGIAIAMMLTLGLIIGACLCFLTSFLIRKNGRLDT